MSKDMTKYAVIKIKGKQMKVSEGDEILVSKLGGNKPQVDVLLYVNKEKVNIGKPTLKNVKVKIKVLEDEVKGKKLYVQTFKAKSRYRRKIGFRPVYSKIKVEKIT